MSTPQGDEPAAQPASALATCDVRGAEEVAGELLQHQATPR